MIGTGAFWQTLSKKTREQIKVHNLALSKGQFKDFAEAKELVGKISSLEWVLGQASEILGDNKHQALPEEDEEF